MSIDVHVKRGYDSTLGSLESTDGSIIFTKDGRNLYLDYLESDIPKRIKISDIITFDSDSAYSANSENINLTNKLVVVNNSKIIFNGEILTDSTSSEYYTSNDAIIYDKANNKYTLATVINRLGNNTTSPRLGCIVSDKDKNLAIITKINNVNDVTTFDVEPLIFNHTNVLRDTVNLYVTSQQYYNDNNLDINLQVGTKEFPFTSFTRLLQECNAILLSDTPTVIHFENNEAETIQNETLSVNNVTLEGSNAYEMNAISLVSITFNVINSLEFKNFNAITDSSESSDVAITIENTSNGNLKIDNSKLDLGIDYLPTTKKVEILNSNVRDLKVYSNLLINNSAIESLEWLGESGNTLELYNGQSSSQITSFNPLATYIVRNWDFGSAWPKFSNGTDFATENSLDSRLVFYNNTIENYSTKTKTLHDNLKGIDLKLGDINTKLSNLTGVYKIKGSSTIADLPTNPNIGDVYNITDSGTITGTEIVLSTGDNVVYTSEGWDKLAATVDLSGYQEKLIFDTTPTEGSTNPVTSGGIKEYIIEATAEDIDNWIGNSDTTSVAGEATAGNAIVGI